MFPIRNLLFDPIAGLGTSLPPKEELERLMRSYGVRATHLSQQSGVSKGTISKILRGKVEPTYSTMKLLFDTLYKMASTSERTVGNIMTRKVITADEQESLASIKKKMLDKAISQIPVLSENRVIGLVTESSILAHPQAMKAKEALAYDYLVVNSGRSIAGLRNLIVGLQAIVVVKDGKLEGILSKADFLR